MEPIGSDPPSWNIFFMFVGFICLFSWNVILNIIPYFDLAIEDNFFSVLSFAFMLSQTVGFLTADKLFSKVSTNKLMLWSSLILFVMLNLILLFVETPEGSVDEQTKKKNVFLNKALTFASTLVIAYTTSVYQGRTVSLVSGIGEKEVVFWNFGGAISGVLASVISIVLGIIFPDPSTPDSSKQLEVLRTRVVVFVIISAVLFLVYYIVTYVFNRAYPTTLDDKKSNLIEQESQPISEPPSAVKVIKTALPFLLGVMFLFIVTIHLLTRLVFQFTQSHHSDTLGITMGIFFLVFNVGDAIGKFVKPFLAYTPNSILHLLNLSRVAIWALCFSIARKESSAPSFMHGQLFFSLLMLVIGLTNGLFVNSYMVKATDQFTEKAEKGLAGYYSVLFLILGLLGGSILGLFI